MYTTSSQSNHLLMDIWVGSHVLAIVNRAVMTMQVHVSFSRKVLSGCIPRVGLHGYRVVLGIDV